MEELIEEVEMNIKLLNLNLERQKKNYKYPFTDNPAHYYRLMMIQKSIEVWTECLNRLQIYKRDRWGPVEARKSKDFKLRIKVEKESVPGFIMNCDPICGSF